LRLDANEQTKKYRRKKIKRKAMTITSGNTIKKLLILFLVFAGLFFARDFLIPLAIGGVLATLALPFCAWMERKRVPKGLAAFICLLVIVVIVTAIFFLLGWQISELTEDITLVKEKVKAWIESTQKYIYAHLGISVKSQWDILKNQQSSIPKMVQSVAGSLTGIFTASFLILIYMLFLLYYREHLKKFILRLFVSQQGEAKEVVVKAAHVSQQYLLGLAKMIACLWIMYSIGFSIAGVKNPFFYAFLCGLLEIVPYVGNITGTSITLIVSAVHGASVPMLVGITVTYATIQFIQGWVLEPLIVGPQVKINPLITIIALVIGQLLWGIPGIILAIPLTGMFKIACDHIEPLKPYGFLLGEAHTHKQEPDWIKKMKTWFKKKKRA
jgi:predicted PurR-regulated permease PerM